MALSDADKTFYRWMTAVSAAIIVAASVWLLLKYWYVNNAPMRARGHATKIVTGRHPSTTIEFSDEKQSYVIERRPTVGDGTKGEVFTLHYYPDDPAGAFIEGDREQYHLMQLITLYLFAGCFFMAGVCALLANWIEPDQAKPPEPADFWYKFDRNIQIHLSTGVVLMVCAGILMAIESTRFADKWGTANAIAQLLDFAAYLIVALAMIAFLCEIFLWPTRIGLNAAKSIWFWIGPRLQHKGQCLQVTRERSVLTLLLLPFIPVIIFLLRRAPYDAELDASIFHLLIILAGGALWSYHHGVTLDKENNTATSWWAMGIRRPRASLPLSDFHAVAVTNTLGELMGAPFMDHQLTLVSASHEEIVIYRCRHSQGHKLMSRMGEELSRYLGVPFLSYG